MGKEVSASKQVIRSWAANNGLEGLLVVALGGYLVYRLAAKMSLAVVVIMINEGAFSGSADALPAVYLLTMFIHMSKDKRRVWVDKNSKMPMKNGIEV